MAIQSTTDRMLSPFDGRTGMPIGPWEGLGVAFAWALGALAVGYASCALATPDGRRPLPYEPSRTGSATGCSWVRRSRPRTMKIETRTPANAITAPAQNAFTNTSQQIGGAVGIALLSTIAFSTSDDKIAGGAAVPVALTDGFANAFWAGAVIAFAGVLVSIFMVGGQRDLLTEEQPVAEAPLQGLVGRGGRRSDVARAQERVAERKRADAQANATPSPCHGPIGMPRDRRTG